jgi:hypothetical protein
LTPVPLRLTGVVVPVEELLVMVNWPVEAPTAEGSNATTMVATGLDELSVSGKLMPENENPWPEMAT